MSIEDKLIEVAENVPKVYEAGKQAEYDAFWDIFQNYGNPQSYYYALSYNRFTDANYNPKYPFRASSTASAFQNMFYNSNKITDTKVLIDTYNTTHVGAMFIGMSKLETVKQLHIREKVTAGGGNIFSGCTSLKNIVISGVIPITWSMSDCPLTRESIMSVYNALSTTATGKTCTFKQTAVKAAFTDEEWAELTANKSNWTFTLV